MAKNGKQCNVHHQENWTTDLGLFIQENTPQHGSRKNEWGYPRQYETAVWGRSGRRSTCSVIPFRWSSRTGKAMVYKLESVCQWGWRLIGLGRRKPRWRNVLHVNQRPATRVYLTSQHRTTAVPFPWSHPHTDGLPEEKIKPACSSLI